MSWNAYVSVGSTKSTAHLTRAVLLTSVGVLMFAPNAAFLHAGGVLTYHFAAGQVVATKRHVGTLPYLANSSWVAPKDASHFKYGPTLQLARVLNNAYEKVIYDSTSLASGQLLHENAGFCNSICRSNLIDILIFG
ncbi:hypothetical protein H257_13001 [Aphanomyces astaci]|uniref:Uncharacterized protein n=1 Tax=Aphanomyces astaci TaxID=112090 RepID=W4FYW4_APHAT|nr:hypothetical protein H257_13001 [Aphanomyces astaci]ETV71868.1 hypothetical protein H257_13001 [Aphanomyces astaci]|eukprot:XP_009838717.1 hypothetical protein H257_13001 [Aphanomyces astaci]